MKLSHRLARLLASGREYTITDFENMTKASHTPIRKAIAELEQYGLVHREMSRAGILIFRKANSPVSGECGPAQPGYVGGAAHGVTRAATALPLTRPEALNPLPANGGANG